MVSFKTKRMSGLTLSMLFFLFLILQGYSCFAQESVFEFKPFNALYDITSSKTTVIIEDSIGFLWIGTEEGLFRFDGQTVNPYYSEINNPRSLPSNGINNLVLDNKDNLWIGTKNGICRYNREFNDFAPVPDKSKMNAFKDCFIKVLTVNKSGQLFVAYNQVIYTYNQTEGRFTEVVKVDRGDISSLIFDDQNNLWIGNLSNGGLFCYDLKKKQLTSFLHDPLNKQSISINEIKTLAISGQTLWIGTLGKGIDTYNLITKTFKHYPSPKNLENYINSILISRNQKVYVSSLSSFKYFKPKDDCFYDYYHDLNNPFSVGRSLQGIYEDREGNLWNIHSFGGISLAKNNFQFKHIGINDNDLFAPAEKIITAMTHDKYGQFWVSNHSTGIDIYNWKNRTRVRLDEQENNPKSLAEGVIFSIFCDSKKQIWVGSYLGGLQQYNPKTKDFISYRHNPDDSLSIACNEIRSISEDAEGNLWLAAHRLGVDKFDVKKKIFIHYNLKNNELCDLYTNQVFNDSRGNLWVATAWGLAFLRKGDHIFTSYHYDKDDTTSISNNEIQTIYEDRLNNIWVGTNDGLNKFDYATQKFSRYSSGLKNKHIASILSDRHNNIWVSTSTGISKFDPKTLQFTNYNQNDGILSKEFYDRSCSMDSLGNLYFGGSDGYDFFCPDSVKPETRKPDVILTDFQLFNKSISSRNDSLIIDRHISYTKKISLDYFQNSVTFHYQAINLTEANKIVYAYKLDGFDKNWVNAHKGRVANYTNLNPGEYTFRVKAKFENGDWNTNDTNIELSIFPAWWMTTWFKILTGLTIIGIIYAIVYFRIKRLQNQGEILKNLVTERTLEIQKNNEMLGLQALTLAQKNEELRKLNSTKNKLFSVISHDLRGPFNLILGFQSVFLRDYKEYSTKERLEMVRKTYIASQKVFNLVENLLNWTKIQTSDISYNPVEFDVKRIIEERMDLQLNMAVVKGISFENQITEGLIAYADIDLLEAVLRNLINNAVKYTPKGGTILIGACQHDDFIHISVIDSGTGMTKKQIDKLFNHEDVQVKSGTEGEKGSGLGLVLCKEFVEKNKGLLTIESKPGKGSTFSFTVPTPKPQ